MTPFPALAPALAGAVACLLSAVCLRPVRRMAPYLTGMALAAATAGALMTAYGAPDRWVSAILLAAAAVALLGLIADVGALPLVTRLIVESLAAGGVVLCGVQVTLTGDWLDGPVSVMWIVAMTNAYGLLDRLGGALAAVAAVTGAFLSVTALVLGDPALAMLPAALTGACLGAIPYGRARGRARLGPSGSLFAGFVLTCTAAGLTAGRGTAVIAAGLLLAGAGRHRGGRGVRRPPGGPAREPGDRTGAEGGARAVRRLGRHRDGRARGRARLGARGRRGHGHRRDRRRGALLHAPQARPLHAPAARLPGAPSAGVQPGAPPARVRLRAPPARVRLRAPPARPFRACEVGIVADDGRRRPAARACAAPALRGRKSPAARRAAGVTGISGRCWPRGRWTGPSRRRRSAGCACRRRARSPGRDGRGCGR